MRCCVVLPRRAVTCPIGFVLGCICIKPTTLGAAGVMEQQPPYKPNGVMLLHDRAAHWLLRHWECVPSLKERMQSIHAADAGLACRCPLSQQQRSPAEKHSTCRISQPPTGKTDLVDAFPFPRCETWGLLMFVAQHRDAGTW